MNDAHVIGGIVSLFIHPADDRFDLSEVAAAGLNPNRVGAVVEGGADGVRIVRVALGPELLNLVGDQGRASAL